MTAPDADPQADTTLLTRTVTIVNRRGLHARAAARFVKTVERFKAEVTVVRKDSEVSGLSIMGLMMLAAGPGSKVTLHVKGEDANNAIAELEALVKRKFDED